MKNWFVPARFVFLLAVFALSGCEGSKTAKVSGKITYKSQPISYGQVTFVGPNGELGVGPIADGQYTVHSAPKGAVKISVKAFPAGPTVVNPSDPNATKVAPKGPVLVKIPAEYGEVATSNLTYTVIDGDQTHDIDLP